MDRSVEPGPTGAADGSADELNRWLGRRVAFSLVAGRCSAADVECMRRIREGKLYASHASNWESSASRNSI
jgi:hypothetical protein